MDVALLMTKIQSWLICVVGDWKIMASSYSGIFCRQFKRMSWLLVSWHVNISQHTKLKKQEATAFIGWSHSCNLFTTDLGMCALKIKRSEQQGNCYPGLLLRSRVAICPSLLEKYLVYTCCPGLIINSAAFSLQCPSLDNELYGYPTFLWGLELGQE